MEFFVHVGERSPEQSEFRLNVPQVFGVLSPLRLHSLSVDPSGDFFGIEADELADLDERDPPLGYQTTNETGLDPEPGSDLVDAEERGLQRRASPGWVRTFL